HEHKKGVWHRDLKLKNVLLDENGEPKVSDFGLATFQDERKMTHTGQVMGTLRYMAPEQAAGRTKQIGARSDVWQLGRMLYELFTGKLPFEGKTYEEVRKKILNKDPVSPRAVRPQIEKPLERIVLKCLEKEPGQRYQSAGALAEDLGRYLQRE